MATRIREKAKVRKETADKRPRATARYVRISSRKVKIVIDLIRGKQVDEALAILMYTPKAAAPVVEKLLLSAIANAENNLSMDRGSLSRKCSPTRARRSSVTLPAAAAARPRCSSARATSPSCSTRSKEVFGWARK